MKRNGGFVEKVKPVRETPVPAAADLRKIPVTFSAGGAPVLDVQEEFFFRLSEFVFFSLRFPFLAPPARREHQRYIQEGSHEARSHLGRGR